MLPKLIVFLSLFLALPAVAKENDIPKPSGDPSHWIGTDDYPAAALRNGEEGRVFFRLDVDETGALTSCTIIESSGYVSLDDATCRVMRERATFKPARDSKGRAVSSFIERSVTWRLPETERVPYGPKRRIVQLRIAPDNVVTDCRMDNDGVDISEAECIDLIEEDKTPPFWLYQHIGLIRSAPVIVNMERSFTPDGMELPALLADREKTEIIYLKRTKLRWSAAGDVTGCEIVEWKTQTVGTPQPPCYAKVVKRFEATAPDSAERLGIEIIAISFKRE